MEEKVEKFESKLSKEIDKLYKQLETVKKDYEHHIKEFGFDITLTSQIAKIQIIEAQINILEDTMDEFGTIFERDNDKAF